MKTLNSVLLSTAIMAATAGVLGYAAYRYVAAMGERLDAEAHSPKPGMPDAATQARTEGAAEAVLASLRPRLQASERPVAQITLMPMARDELKASKLGGRAYWAAGRDYPRDPGGRPLVLLAQIDLAEAGLAGYPQRGLLQFFISDRGDHYGANFDAAGGDLMQALTRPQGFRVVHWPDADAPAQAPPVLAAAAERLPFDPQRPRRMRFSAGRESIGANDSGWAATLGAPLDDLAEAYAGAHPGLDREALADALYQRLRRSGHKFGGHPDFTQSDPRDPGDRRVLLLQLDSDDSMMWGDSGIANFFIDPDDLKRGEFGRVAYHWDCY